MKGKLYPCQIKIAQEQAERQREQEEWEAKVAEQYDYQRTWLSQEDAIRATLHRYSLTEKRLKRICVQAGVWEP